METNWRVAALFAEILRKVLVLLPGLPARQQHNLGRWRSSTRVTYCFSGGKVFPNLSTFAQHSSCWFPSSPDLDIPSIPGIPSLVPVRRLKSLLLPSLRSACPLHTHTHTHTHPNNLSKESYRYLQLDPSSASPLSLDPTFDCFVDDRHFHCYLDAIPVAVFVHHFM